MRKSIFISFKIFLTFAVFCIESKRLSSDITLKNVVTNFGYPFEIYETTTKDGYILQIHRIPRGRNEAQNMTKKKQVALLMHGLVGSSATWLITGPHRSLALTLADKGYDVWLGNNRGNTYSSKHNTKLETSYEYWDFSWHEMGIHDLPTTIDFVLNKTGQEKLLYNCFSQGCTQMLVMGSLKPEYNKKISFALLFAPAAFMGHSRGILTLFWPVTYLALYSAEIWGYFPIGGANPVLRIFTSFFCKRGVVLQELCIFFIFLGVGFGYDEVDRKHIADFLAFEPAGSSWKQVIHYGLNCWNEDTFRLYDYGSKKNLKLYNSTTPPDYPLENVNFPIAMFHGINDYLASPKDVELLATKLPNVIKRHLVTKRKLNHYDFVYGLRTRDLVYNQALKLYDDYIEMNN